MNERIRELMEQAGLVRGGWANTPEKIMTWRESFDNPGSLEKFAELIVRECIDVGQHEFLHGSTVPVFPAIQIKKHFGVE